MPASDKDSSGGPDLPATIEDGSRPREHTLEASFHPATLLMLPDDQRTQPPSKQILFESNLLLGIFSRRC